MALVARIYSSTPKDGSKRVVVHGSNGQTHSANGLFPDAFTAAVRQRDGSAVDRSNEMQHQGSRVEKTRVLGRDGYFQSANSRDSLLSERPEPEMHVRIVRRKHAPTVLAVALGVRQVNPVVQQQAEKPVSKPKPPVVEAVPDYRTPLRSTLDGFPVTFTAGPGFLLLHPVVPQFARR